MRQRVTREPVIGHGKKRYPVVVIAFFLLLSRSALIAEIVSVSMAKFIVHQYIPDSVRSCCHINSDGILILVDQVFEESCVGIKKRVGQKVMDFIHNKQASGKRLEIFQISCALIPQDSDPNMFANI